MKNNSSSTNVNNTHAISLDLSQLADSIAIIKLIDPRYLSGPNDSARAYDLLDNETELSYDRFKEKLLNDPKGIDQTTKDLRRDSDSVITIGNKKYNLAETISKHFNIDKKDITRNQLTEYLTTERGLSEQQANFIASSLYQAGFGGYGFAQLGDTLMEVDLEFSAASFSAHKREGVAVNIEIDDKNNCSIMTANTLYPMQLYKGDNLGKLSEALKDNNCLTGSIESSDNLSIFTKIDLGEVGGSQIPKTTLDISAKGSYTKLVDHIIEEQRKANKDCAQLKQSDVVGKVTTFEKAIFSPEQINQQKKKFQGELVKFLEQQPSEQDKKYVEKFLNPDENFAEIKAQILLNILTQNQNLDTNSNRQQAAIPIMKELKAFFPNESDNYLKRFSKDIVNEYAKKERGFWAKLVSNLKDMMAGYSKTKLKDELKNIKDELAEKTNTQKQQPKQTPKNNQPNRSSNRSIGL